MDVVKEADRQPRAEPVAAEDGAGEDLALKWPECDGGGHSAMLDDSRGGMHAGRLHSNGSGAHLNTTIRNSTSVCWHGEP